MIDLGDDFFWPSHVLLVSSSHLFDVCVARRVQENWIFWDLSSRCLRIKCFVWFYWGAELPGELPDESEHVPEIADAFREEL